MDQLVLSELDIHEDTVEVVERKGLGHPDTICDALAEALSRALCHEYRRLFGEILHYNVDKALLCAGRAAAAFGGGKVIAPINIYLAGRATSEFKDHSIPIHDIAVESSRAWLHANLHALDAEQHVRIHALTQPGSQGLQALFSLRSPGDIALANDTSVGVGHAPLSPLERLVLAIESRVNGRDRHRERPAWGEDIKIMGIRVGGRIQLVIACAMIGRYLGNVDDYLSERSALTSLVRDLAIQHGFPESEISVNAADRPAAGQTYLTVTGTSAEAGDDGQVGRGNRVNGLITPCRPMSFEAAAGKNPLTHVGKIYNVVARDIAEAVVTELPQVGRTECLMVSRIGSPVASPAIVAIKLATREGLVSDVQSRVQEIAVDRIGRIPALVDDFVAGRVRLF
jgi:S-adenosylmethionine synthetase